MAPSATLETPIPKATSIIPSTMVNSNASSALSIGDASHDYTEPALLHRSLIEKPHNVESASGIYLKLRDGRRIIDACGGAAVATIGHGNEEVLKATVAQMMKVSYVHTASYTTDSAEDLARFLLAGNEYGFEKAYFVGSGSEANDSVMKMARQYFFEQGQTQRKHFVSRKQGYHGNSIGAMSISTNLARKVPYQDVLTLPYVSHVSPAYAYRYKVPSESDDDYVIRLADELEDEFLRIGPEKVVAFVAEPVVGATSGCVASPKGYFPAVRNLCNKYGILLILDEVMCGMGRTGSVFAFEQDDVVPDLVTIGKGLGGGYAPIAAILVGKKVVDVLRQGSSAFNHGHTYQAHSVSCATALAVQKIVRREKLVDRCAEMGRLLGIFLRNALEGCKYVGDIRGRGLFWAVEFVKDKKTKKCFDRTIGFGLRVQQASFERGVAVYPGGGTVDGIEGDHVLLAPPYNVTEASLMEIVHVLKEAYDSQETYVDRLE